MDELNEFYPLMGQRSTSDAQMDEFDHETNHMNESGEKSDARYDNASECMTTDPLHRKETRTGSSRTWEPTQMKDT